MLWRRAIQIIEGIKTHRFDGGPKTVILFHGYGASADDLAPLRQLSPEHTWLFPQGPLEAFPGRAWFPIDIEAICEATARGEAPFGKHFPPELTEMKAQLKRFLKALAIPPEDCILGGFSQGAIVATDLVLSSEQKMGGLMVFSGTLANEENWGRTPHAGIPFFQSHGKQDPILLFHQAEALEKLLQKVGLQGQLNAFEGGHEIPQEILLKARDFLCAAS